MPCPCTLLHNRNAPCDKVETRIQLWDTCLSRDDREMFALAGIAEPVSVPSVERWDDDD